MKIFLAGASGAIGRPLVAALLRQGHTVTAMTRRAVESCLAQPGVTTVAVDALDVAAVQRAIHDAQPDAVIDELTSLPKNPADIAAYLPGDRRIRIEGGGNLLCRPGLRRFPLPPAIERLLLARRNRPGRRIGGHGHRRQPRRRL